ncbi:hypothetical protein I3842_03G055000 [Carya illinoinensis]|uniref:Uncharacterized protein n=1 Tax=Carya illinoinensis TaxID=32201 RepID=A0A922FGF6_CARIL|nr:hypothetical protein I3842_03G055000 [Carya illinoinensis]
MQGYKTLCINITFSFSPLISLIPIASFLPSFPSLSLLFSFDFSPLFVRLSSLNASGDDPLFLTSLILLLIL